MSKIKFGLIIIAFAFAFAWCAPDAAAQQKRRIGLPEGADSLTVQGKITGRQYVLYEIYVEKGDEWSVDLKSANRYIGYTVKDASGSRYDFLENAPVSGFYTIRVELNAAGAKKNTPAAFALEIKFMMERNEPLS